MLVFDRSGNIIENGDVVVCLYPIDGKLSLNRLYTVKETISLEGQVIVQSDFIGRFGRYNARRFQKVDLTNLPQV